MFRSKWILAVAVAGLCGAGIALAATVQKDYHIGRAATPAEISGWNIDVRGDGVGLPKGQGSVGQGEKVYDAHCAMCHGTFGDSNQYMQLAGGVGSLKTDTPQSTVGSLLNEASTLFDYINRAMPFPHSKALTPDEVYAVTAYVLNLNNVVPDDFVANSETLPKVEMPNKDGFERFWALSYVTGKGKPDTDNTTCMHDCAKDVKVVNAIPAAGVKALYGDIADNFRGLATMNEAAPLADQLVAAASGAAGEASSSAHAPLELIQKYSCSACHSVDQKIVGPAFRDVAQKFKGNPDAEKILIQAIRSGSTGVWGSAAMPPQTAPSDADLESIVKWVLAGAPGK